MKLCTAVQEGCGYKDTLRASLLCSIGKIFHCVHYLSADPRMFIGLYVKYALFMSDFNETLNFLDRCSKNTQILSLMKICPVGVELLHADGRTDGRT